MGLYVTARWWALAPGHDGSSYRHSGKRPAPEPGGRWLSPMLSGVVLLVVAASSVAAQPKGAVVGAVVTRVMEGDSIEVQIGSKTEKVRYIGITTPEIQHPTRGPEPYSQAARAANAQLVAGKNVVLALETQHRDRDGRLLAHVYVGDRFVNAELVGAGYAEVGTIPPNVRHREQFVALQRQARLARRGLWADPEVVQYHRQRPAGVFGNTRLRIYLHPDDGARNLLLADVFVYFESPQQAAAAGYRPSMDYASFARRDERLLSGESAASPDATLTVTGRAHSWGSYPGSGTATSPGNDPPARRYYRGGTYVVPDTRSSPQR